MGDKLLFHVNVMLNRVKEPGPQIAKSLATTIYFAKTFYTTDSNGE